jgi:hypothetical protein
MFAMTYMTQTQKNRYRHNNPNWAHLYNATAISAIKDPSQTRKEGIIAFLCVDSKNGGFWNGMSKAILGIVSNYLYYSFINTLVICG